MLINNAPVNPNLTGQQFSVPMNSAQTMVDANGQQFFMVPIGSIPQSFPSMMNAPNVNFPTFSGGRTGGRRGSNRNQGQMRGRTGGRNRRGYTKPSGIFYAYCMDVAPLNIFENQVLPTGLHDVSKSLDLIWPLQESSH